jgi:hypothetical protein
MLHGFDFFQISLPTLIPSLGSLRFICLDAIYHLKRMQKGGLIILCSEKMYVVKVSLLVATYGPLWPGLGRKINILKIIQIVGKKMFINLLGYSWQLGVNIPLLHAASYCYLLAAYQITSAYYRAKI